MHTVCAFVRMSVGYILTEKYTHTQTRPRKVFSHLPVTRCRGFVNDFFPLSRWRFWCLYTHTHTPTHYKTHVYTHRGTLTSRQTETAGVGVGSTENEGDRDVCKRWHGGSVCGGGVCGGLRRSEWRRRRGVYAYMHAYHARPISHWRLNQTDVLTANLSLVDVPCFTLFPRRREHAGHHISLTNGRRHRDPMPV